MKFTSSRTLGLISPYAAWIGLMMFLPSTAWAYAVRGGVTAALLVATALSKPALALRAEGRSVVALVSSGIVAGLVVLLVWIAPETWFGVGSAIPAGESPYAPQVCGWPLTIVKLAASALVIPIAEELFFRRWMVEFAGFWWTVALFASVHGERWAVGAVTGVIYGLLARKLGLGAAIVAHGVTNLALGVYVVWFDKWQFW